MWIKNAVLYREDFLPAAGAMRIDGDRITGFADRAPEDAEALDLSGMTVVPGFIDIHIHGCAGYTAEEATPEALGAMSSFLVQHGVTSFCPASMTLGEEPLDRMFVNIAAHKDTLPGAYIQGINMEGPYIALSRKGGQNPDFVRRPDAAEFRRLFAHCGGAIRLVDLAPELPGAEEFVREIEPLCATSVAHTEATYEEVCCAFSWGTRHITHFYNAQTGLTHRQPGVVGAVLDKAKELGIQAELICDGFHVHPAALRIAFAQLGEDNSIIISDALAPAGCADGMYSSGGLPVIVRDGKALLEDGTIAGSTTNLYDEWKNVLSFGIPMTQALKSLTINPARAIRAERETGSLSVGKAADLVVVDATRRIRLVMVRGKISVNNL